MNENTLLFDEQGRIKDFTWVILKIEELQQNIQYLLEILACYADAFLKIKQTIEQLHNISLDPPDPNSIS